MNEWVVARLTDISMRGFCEQTPKSRALAAGTRSLFMSNERAAASHIPSLLSDGVELAVDGPHRYTLYHVSALYDRAALLILLLHWPIYSFAWELCPRPFQRSTPGCPPPLNPLPFAIDVHLSIFACVWAYFGRASVTRQKRGPCGK